jgi:hypothetical protein
MHIMKQGWHHHDTKSMTIIKLNAWASSSRQTSSDNAGISKARKSNDQGGNHRADKHHYSSNDWHHVQIGIIRAGTSLLNRQISSSGTGIAK